MARFNYAQLQGGAGRLIEKFGQAATLRKVTSTGGLSPVRTTEDHDCTIVVTEYSMRERAGAGGLIRGGDKKVLMSARNLEVAPDVSYRLVIGDQDHEIRSVDPLVPGGVAVMYTLQVGF